MNAIDDDVSWYMDTYGVEPTYLGRHSTGAPMFSEQGVVMYRTGNTLRPLDTVTAQSEIPSSVPSTSGTVQTPPPPPPIHTLLTFPLKPSKSVAIKL